MIHFINIDNGRVYNGDKPYVHWFDGQQSIDLVYVQKLCVITTDFNLHVSLPKNDVFHLLNVETILQPDENPTILDQITYKDIQAMYCNDLDMRGVRYEHSKYYIYMIYIAGCSNIAIEAKESLFIGDNEYTVGADFYDEREELKINVSNQGLDLPESVQRAIYPSNVHEEAKDNILLNRKYKELLMDYMSILGNRGSYSSLINSMNWFEYGDLLQAKEFWKHHEGSRIEFNSQPLSQVLQDTAKSMLTEYSKSTYIGLYCACQSMKKAPDGSGVEYETESISQSVEDSNFKWARLSGTLPNNDGDSGKANKQLQILSSSVNVDDPIPGANEDKVGSNWGRATKQYSNIDRFIGEGVPALQKSAFLWSRLDMSIKMALLGNFYESYFMPVHLDLIHSTIEDIVFTNTIKITNHGHIDRTDHVTNVHALHCNIKDGQQFMLGNVEVNATIHTPFVNAVRESTQYDTYNITGIQDVSSHGYLNLDILTDQQGNIISPDSRGANYNPQQAVQYNEQFHTFYLNNYSGTGVVVPFVFDIDLEKGDFISRMMLGYFNPNLGKWELLESPANKELWTTDPITGRTTIKFELLCTHARVYDLRFQFTSAGSRVYVKRLQIHVVDDYSATIEVYKVKRGIPAFTTDLLDGRFDVNENFNEYLFSHVLHTDYDQMHDAHKYYIQYIPVDIKTATDVDAGVGLNRVIIFRKEVLSLIENFIMKDLAQSPADVVAAMKNSGKILSQMPDSEAESIVSALRNNLQMILVDDPNGIRRFLRSYKYNWDPTSQQWTDEHSSITIVDTYFNGKDPNGTDHSEELNDALDAIKNCFYGLSRYAVADQDKQDWERAILRDEMIYIPHFHKIEPLFESTVDDKGNNTRPSLEQLTVSANDCLCVVPDLKFTKHFLNGKSVELEWTEWIFRNASTETEYRLPSIREPYIAPDNGKYERLPRGYYDVIFRYKLADDSEVRQITRESAFIQK